MFKARTVRKRRKNNWARGPSFIRLKPRLGFIRSHCPKKKSRWIFCARQAGVGAVA